MNTSASKPEGGTHEPRTIDFAATHHWACGMPLSYVHEMANHCLNCLSGQAGGPAAPEVLEFDPTAAHQLRPKPFD